MNILLITDQYPPEIRAISFMMQELAEFFADKGHIVTVITSMPQPELVENQAKINIPTLDVQNGVKVIRVAIPFKIRKGNIHKAFNQLSIPTLFHRKIKKLIKNKIDAVIVYTPPLSLGLVGIKVKEYYGANYLLNIQDIFPQNAIDLGILRNKFIIKYFESMESKIYKSADRITAHTNGGKEYLKKYKNIQRGKISTVSNWLDFKTYQNANPKKYFRKKYGLENKFIILSAGIMGPAQNLDFILRIAGMLNDLPEICFLLVGEGSEKKRLQRIVNDNKSQNVLFKDYVTRDEYPFLAKEVDIGLVSLADKNKTPVMPGKILGFMAASLPTVAFMHKESDGHKLIKEAHCGYSMVPDSQDNAAKLIENIYYERSDLKKLGNNGYRYALQHFSKEVCIGKIEQLIQ